MSTTSTRVGKGGRVRRRTRESQAAELKALGVFETEQEDREAASASERAQLKARAAADWKSAEADRSAADARTASLVELVSFQRQEMDRLWAEHEKCLLMIQGLDEQLKARAAADWKSAEADRSAADARNASLVELVNFQQKEMDRLRAEHGKCLLTIQGPDEQCATKEEELRVSRAEGEDEHGMAANPTEPRSMDTMGARQLRLPRPPTSEFGGPAQAASLSHSPAPDATEVLSPLGSSLGGSLSPCYRDELDMTADPTEPWAADGMCARQLRQCLPLPPTCECGGPAQLASPLHSPAPDGSSPGGSLSPRYRDELDMTADPTEPWTTDGMGPGSSLPLNLRVMTDAASECGGPTVKAEPVVVPLGSSTAEGEPRGHFRRLFGCFCRRRAGCQQLKYYDGDGRTHVLEVKDGELRHTAEDGSVSQVSRLSIRRLASGAVICEDRFGIATLSDDQLRSVEILTKAGKCILDEAPKGGRQVAPGAAAVAGLGAARGTESSAPLGGALKSRSPWAEDPYSKAVSQELFTSLLGSRDSKSGPQFVEERVFKVAWRSLARNASLGASLSAQDLEVRGAISKKIWTTQLESRFATVDKERFLELCRQCVADVRNELPDDVSRKSPWFDLDFSALGKCANRIKKVEDRAITIHQLQRLEAFIQNQTDQAGVLKGWWDRTTRAPVVRKPGLNLYQVADWVINPATAPHQCSFVELLTTEREQPAEWFISHWWGEPVVDFIACLENHSRTRSLPETSAYWVCAYANNQHELGLDLAEDPLRSSFARALRRACGVLLILDDQATPFTRVWCCFEEAVTVLKLGSRQNQKLLDIATVSDGNPQLLTEGLTEEETRVQKIFEEEPWKPTGWSKKSKREATFPITIIRKGLAVDLAKANATEDIDKTRILNCIAGRPEQELNEPPDAHHHKYDAVNRALAGFFAVAAMRSAIEAGKDISSEEICAEEYISDGKALPLLRSLREDRQRQDLVLYLSGMEQFWDANLTALCRNLPQQLVTLNLDCSKCSGFTSLGELWPGLSNLWALTRLELNFSNCTGVTSLGHLGRHLFGLRVLRVLTLNLSECSGLTSVGDLGQGLSGLRSLTGLTLILRRCRLTSLGDLGQGLAGLEKLTKLELNLAHLPLTSMGDLGQGLARLQALTWLRLSFRGCNCLTSVGDLGQGLAALQALTTLKLSFAFSGLTSVGGLEQGLTGLQALTTACLSFDGCSDLASLGGLAQGLAALQALTKLELKASSLPEAAVERLRQDHAALARRCFKLVFPLPRDEGSDFGGGGP